MGCESRIDPVASITGDRTVLELQADSKKDARDRWLPCFLLLVLTLGLTAVFVSRGIRRGEFSLNIDETIHACTGLYLASFIHNLPLRHPIQYTLIYYAHYPALGLIEYPPVFYVGEGVMFLFFGPTVLTARITVLLFALLGAYFLFRTVWYLADEWTAAACTLLVALLPSVLLYEKANMLDLPAMALGVAAAYYWIRYLREERPRLLYAFCVFAVLELLTKQQALYVLLWCLLTVTVMRKWRLVLNRNAILSACLCTAALLPYYLYTVRLTFPVVAANVAHGNITQRYPYVYYLIQLPEQLGWPLLVLSIAGLATCYWWGKRENVVPMLLWIVACFVTETAMSNKVPRYIIYWIPPLVYFAAAPLTLRGKRPNWVRVGLGVVLAGLLVHAGWVAWSFQRPYVSGYARLARRLLEEKQGIVLADVRLPGDLIFFVCGSDPEGRFIIDRKALFVTRNLKKYGSMELVQSTEDLQNTMRRNGVKYVAIEEGMSLGFEAQHLLRDLLRTKQFKPLAEFPVETNDREFAGHRLLLYENLEAVPPSADIYRVRMMTLDDDITVPMSTMVGGFSSSRPSN